MQNLRRWVLGSLGPWPIDISGGLKKSSDMYVGEELYSHDSGEIRWNVSWSSKMNASEEKRCNRWMNCQEVKIQGAARNFDPFGSNIVPERVDTSEFCLHQKLRLVLKFLWPKFQIGAPIPSGPDFGNIAKINDSLWGG